MITELIFGSLVSGLLSKLVFTPSLSQELGKDYAAMRLCPYSFWLTCFYNDKEKTLLLQYNIILLISGSLAFITTRKIVCMKRLKGPRIV